MPNDGKTFQHEISRPWNFFWNFFFTLFPNKQAWTKFNQIY